MNVKKQREIEKIVKKYTNSEFVINDDLSVSVYGNFSISFSEIEELPIKLKYIEGYLRCSWNKLKSFKNFPNHIGGDLEIDGNAITSMDNFPKRIGGKINMEHNLICGTENIDIEKYMNGDFKLDSNPIAYILEFIDDINNIELFIESDIIRLIDEKYFIVSELFNDFLKEIDKKVSHDDINNLCINLSENYEFI